MSEKDSAAFRGALLLSCGLAWCSVGVATTACGSSSVQAPNEGLDKHDGGTGAAGSTESGGSTGSTTTGSGGATSSGGSTGKGGTTSTGGTTGTGGTTTIVAPPHVVGKCDGLNTVNQWEDVTPAGVPLQPAYTGPINVLADPVNSGTVYAMTANAGMYKSTDCGSTWVKTNTGRNAKNIDSGKMWSGVIAFDQPETLYALIGYGAAGVWKTTNAGVDWDQVMPTNLGMPGFVGHIGIDPTNSQHLLTTFHENCTGGHTPVCFGETKDGGANWDVLDFPTSLKGAWGEGTALMPIDATHWLYENWELYLTADAGKNWNKVSDGAGVQGQYFQEPNGPFYVPAANGVITSADGKTWSRIANSPGTLDTMMGDGTSLFAFQGFQPPSSGSTFAWTATYAAPTKWTALKTTGLTSPLVSGATSVVYDNDHHLMYLAIQAAGLWRVVTQ